MRPCPARVDSFDPRVPPCPRTTSASAWRRATTSPGRHVRAGGRRPVVDFLAELAGDGAALELGDRHRPHRAAARASAASACTASTCREAMVARLRAKPGARRDRRDDRRLRHHEGGRHVPLAYLVFNTIMNLTTQDEQVACFRNVAAHLEPGGCFVIEVGVPELQRLPPGETCRPFTVSATQLGFDEYDVAAQGLISHHYRIVDGSARASLGAVPLRVAGGARPDGAARRDDAARALERLDARAVHEREHDARLGLADAAVVPLLVRRAVDPTQGRN